MRDAEVPVGPKLAWGITALLYAWFFWRASTRLGKGVGDFRYFYNAAAAMRTGQDIFASSPDYGYIYPPLIAFLYMPVTWFSEWTAAVVLLLVNTALSALALVLIATEMNERLGCWRARVGTAPVALLGLGLIADKMRIELRMWQTNVLVLLMFVLALRWLDRRPRLAGLALGFAFNIKYLPVVLLPYLLFRRRWRVAAWFALGAILFALLPAVYSGWAENMRNLEVAGAGLVRLFGAHAGKDAANIQDITVHFSLSITSALARSFGPGSTAAALLTSSLIALVCAMVVALMYRARGIPALFWPPTRSQREQPFRALIGVEWGVLLAVTLAFSPQTNSRHLSLLLPACVAASAILLPFRRRPYQVALVAGLLVMVLGINLPPGGPRFAEMLGGWQSAGGPAWCVLMMAMTLAYAGVARAADLSRSDSSHTSIA